jgi:hypothetical protein
MVQLTMHNESSAEKQGHDVTEAAEHEHLTHVLPTAK